MSNKNVKLIQEALIGKGYVLGEADGIWGRRTIAAVKLFQKRMGLDMDGVVGPITRAALFGASATSAPAASEEKSPLLAPVLPWFTEAKSLLGVKEVGGNASNPEILEWASKLEIPYSGDDIPWCGLFVGHCIGATMTDEVLPKNPLGARKWERFGIPVDPRLGAVLVFWRESPSAGKGHVGFYAGEDDASYLVLGGNQSDKVSYAWISKTRHTATRWPTSGATLGGGVGPLRVARGTESNSINEA
eukprot:TRINITY_DN3754_c0_g1_i1.p1 TRINITY_DN3754_c0_g1~~TRINITY_DN3754_c0_g1_i1.p1  ORF type:complete len:246 (-),score=27.51 TRINITY_DN3754_c0_g1_i1:246-983(-)